MLCRNFEVETAVMKKLYPSYQIKTKRVNELPVYQKALELFTLSREMARMIAQDKGILELGRSKERIEKITGHMLSTSMGLAPRIAMVESSKDPRVRIDSLRALQHATGSLGNFCDHIESRNLIAGAMTKRLREEIDHFRKLQSRWAVRLCELN